ncbi:MAG: hypothetical protein ABI420_04220 [Opitutaceae bacterium]
MMHPTGRWPRGQFRTVEPSCTGQVTAQIDPCHAARVSETVRPICVRLRHDPARAR